MQTAPPDDGHKQQCGARILDVINGETVRSDDTHESLMCIRICAAVHNVHAPAVPMPRERASVTTRPRKGGANKQAAGMHQTERQVDSTGGQSVPRQSPSWRL